jgi:hypothetical protein
MVRHKLPRHNRRRRFPKRKNFRPQRGLTSAIMPFKRSNSVVIGLNGSSPPEGWSVSGNNIYKNWGFSLAQLHDNTDFVNLFKYYRLKGVRLQMYFSNNVSTSEDGNNAPSNNQMLMWLDTNKDGADVSASGLETTYLDSQTSKKKLCLRTDGKPIDIYMPLLQQNMTYGGVGNTDYTLQKPKFISTTEPATPHYGFKMMLQRVDGQSFTSGMSSSQYCKIVTTVYLQCRKVE